MKRKALKDLITVKKSRKGERDANHTPRLQCKRKRRQQKGEIGAIKGTARWGRPDEAY